MSRTNKDKPYKFKLDSVTKHSYNNEDAVKKRKELDTEDHWMSTPSWWVRMFMTRPQRVEQKRQMREIAKQQDLEEVDFVDTKRKPQVYYW